MKSAARVIVACVLGGGCVHDALYPGVDEFPGAVTEVPAGSPLAQEIADGYRAYGSLLAPFGEWHRDSTYGARWCLKPWTPTPFVPYLSNGHWIAPEDAPLAHADAAPYWVADADVPRGDITMHHGWWVAQERTGATARWCWVPGTSETPARVIWREADGFVAWAPEPPSIGADEELDDDLLDWFYEFTATLFEDVVEDALLSGDAADAAEAATSAARSRQRASGHAPARTGPTRSQVSAARTALSEYVVAHPVTSTGRPAGKLPSPSLVYAQMAREGASASPSGTSLPKVTTAESRRSGGGSFNGYAGRAGAGRGCNCASQSGGHASSSHNSYAGHAGGGSGGDCGSHSSYRK